MAIDITGINNGLSGAKSTLNEVWIAEEMLLINRVMDNLMEQVSRLSRSLDSIQSDIAITTLEIRHEEQLREEAAREAAAREAALLAARNAANHK